MDHPEIANQLRSFFAQPANAAVPLALPPVGGLPAPGAPGAYSLQGYTIQVRSSEDDEKDITAKLGETRCKLYLIGADADWQDGKIRDISYPTLSAGLKSVHSKPRSSRPVMFQGLIQRAVDQAKAKDVTSIYSKLVTLHVVQKKHGYQPLAR